MALKFRKPVTPGQRHTALVDTSWLTKKEPEKSLTVALKYKTRNSSGRLTVRHRGGRVKRLYRIIDFKRRKEGMKAEVVAVEYDPNRSANILLLKYEDGAKTYILAPDGIKTGDKLESGENAPIKVGNALPLKKIPSGSYVHSVELKRGEGAVLGRAAGAAIQLQGFNKGYAQLKMPSGEIRLVRDVNFATIGNVGNTEHSGVSLGKAGRKRKMGIKPTVRGVAMSWKHPHGGGQGKSGRHGPGGPAKDRWGNKIGKKTRVNKTTNKYIVKRKTSKRVKKVKTYKTIV
ncbi:50S ribosomal protein L2 [Candidatus Dojkabacteria bacterium]|nr:50S ribosomal protein L2 [Candidatus Dojkabacteria bacterium]